ncbi:MAG TPA: murein biosynthesis integral membrane protein MurJ [Gemmatimonadales bacterium]
MSRRGSFFVAAGILLSRIFGLVRQRVIAHFLGQGVSSDILTAAFRIPNFLQNLFGEGALSASFIPSYSKLLGAGNDEDARQLANAVLSLLICTVTAIVLIGELAAPILVHLLVPDWTGAQREITEKLVRILFPAAGMLVISAWCLGVLNSHRKFLLSYATPVVWNTAIIVSVLAFGRGDNGRFILMACCGAVVGSALQIGVQWPVVRRVSGQIQLRSWRGVAGVRTVVAAFFPNMISRGANQISAFIDLSIASYLPHGAVFAIANAQVLYTLPVSLFGMAVSAAELPEMARERGDPETVAKALRIRLSGATQRLAFYIVPSAMGFLTLGGVIAGAVFQTGAFKQQDSRYVWIVLAGSATGLLASTLGRLYASTFYALHDTKTPLRCGIVRVILTGILGILAAVVLPRSLGIDPKWGAAGLTASAGVAGWIEFALLRRGLCRRLGNFDLPTSELVRLWIAALVAGVVGTAVRLAGEHHMGPIPMALLAVPANAVVYLVVTSWWDIPEAAVLTGRIRHALKEGWQSV